MSIEQKPDLVLFAGPVILKEHFESVPWTRPTEVVMVRDGLTSADFRVLGDHEFTDIVRKYTGREPSAFRKIAISAWSKGGSFTDQLLRRPEALQRLDAVVLNDAVFGSKHEGLRAFMDQAVQGKKLLVLTNTNNVASDVISKRARESVEELVGDTASRMDKVSGGELMPEASGGVWKVGDFFWYDYVKSSGVNDISHAAHHDLAADTWSTHLVPYFEDRGNNNMLLAMLGVAAVGAAVVVSRR